VMVTHSESSRYVKGGKLPHLPQHLQVATTVDINGPSNRLEQIPQHLAVWNQINHDKKVISSTHVPKLIEC